MAGNTAVTDRRRVQARLAARDPAVWTHAYLRWAALVDSVCALAAGRWRSSSASTTPTIVRFSTSFRRVLAAGVNLTAAVAICSYAVKFEFARGYVLLSLPLTTALDLVFRHRLRKRLHKMRSRGACMRRGWPSATPRGGRPHRRAAPRPDHGLDARRARLAGGTMLHEIAGVPGFGGRAT